MRMESPVSSFLGMGAVAPECSLLEVQHTGHSMEEEVIVEIAPAASDDFMGGKGK